MNGNIWERYKSKCNKRNKYVENWIIQIYWWLLTGETGHKMINNDVWWFTIIAGDGMVTCSTHLFGVIKS